MVSGLVTSPCDQLRIFSGDARLMRMASKSATGFAISNGLERHMFLRFPAALTRLPAAVDFSSQFAVLSSECKSAGALPFRDAESKCRGGQFKTFCASP